jgi:Ca2+-binding EF-hand superfamily protein
MSKAHNHNDYVSQYITYEEVHNIKQAFDLFDRDLGGAIDPKGTFLTIQNSRLPSTPSVLKPKPKPSTR